MPSVFLSAYFSVYIMTKVRKEVQRMNNNDKRDSWDLMWDIVGVALTGLVVLTILDVVLTALAAVF